MAHRFTKVPLGWVPSNPKGGPPKGPMGRIDDLMQEWTGIWTPKTSHKDLPDPISLITDKLSESNEEPLVLATPEQIRKCSSRFKVRTAVGADRAHPRDFGILCAKLWSALPPCGLGWSLWVSCLWFWRPPYWP